MNNVTWIPNYLIIGRDQGNMIWLYQNVSYKNLVDWVGIFKTFLAQNLGTYLFGKMNFSEKKTS